MNEVKLFENKQIRSVWNAELEEWCLSLVDVIGVLTDSINPTDYLKKLRKRDEILGDYIGTNCPQIEMLTETGKKRKTLSATPKQLFRIVQSNRIFMIKDELTYKIIGCAMKVHNTNLYSTPNIIL